MQWLNVFIVVGKRWVGWSNDSIGNKLDLVFEFNGFRMFKEVKIHSSHIPTRDVKVSVFHYLLIYFCIRIIVYNISTPQGLRAIQLCLISVTKYLILDYDV